MSSDDGGKTTDFRLFRRATVDEKALDPEVRAELGGIHEGTERVNERLREEVAELRAERAELQQRLGSLESENDSLAGQLGELASEVDRVARESAAEEFDPEAFEAALRADFKELVKREDPVEIRELVADEEVYRPPVGMGGGYGSYRPFPGGVEFGGRVGGGVPLDVDAVPATSVLADFRRAIEEVDADVEGSGFTISDVSVGLRAGVKHQDGLALQLPGLLSADSNSLTDLNFAIVPRAKRLGGGETDGPSPLDYTEVPALVGRSRERAEAAVEAAGFTVGSVETAPGEPGRVLEQLPSACALAEPGAAVDLVVGTPADESDADREAAVESLLGTRPTRDAGSSARPESRRGTGGVSEADSDSRERADTDSATDEPTENDSTETATESEPASSGTDESDADAEPEPRADREPDDLTEIDGIGPTYAGRLKEAGIDTYERLARADPRRVGDVARTSTSRAEEWVAAARRLTGAGS